MNDIILNSNKEHISLTACAEVKSLSLPFHETFNSSFFSYVKYYWSGECIILCDRADWMQHFLQEELHQCLSGMPDIRFRDNVFFDDCEKNSPYETHILKKQMNDFDIHHGISIIKRYQGYVEIFSYAAPYAEKYFRSTFIQNDHYFNVFNLYFLDKARKLIRQAEQSKFTFQGLQENNVNFSTMEHVEGGKLNKLCNMLDIKRFDLGNGLYITSREFDCIKLLVSGHSYKVIARELNISYSTVQEYLNNVRYRLSCRNKKDLINRILDSELNKLLKEDVNKHEQYWQEFIETQA